MELDAGRGLGVGQGGLLVQQEGQGRALPQLVLDRAAAHKGLGLSQEVRREVGSIDREGTRHGTQPAPEAIRVSIREPLEPTGRSRGTLQLILKTDHLGKL